MNAVCGEIKYKTIRKEIRSELTSHIDEFADRYGEIYGDGARDMAVKHMGDAKEPGKMLNGSYRMPFNCGFGLMIWAFLNTIMGWAVYPFRIIYMLSLGKPKGKKEFWILPYRGNISFSEIAQNITDNDSFDIYGNKVSRGKIIGDRD